MKYIKLLTLIFFLNIIPTYIFSQCEVCQNVYVWDFTAPDKIDSATIQIFVREVEIALSQLDTCTVLSRRDYGRLLEHIYNENNIKSLSLSKISQEAKDILERIKARMVVFGDMIIYGNKLILYISFQNILDSRTRSLSITFNQNTITNNSYREISEKIHISITNFINEWCPDSSDDITNDNGLDFWRGYWCQERNLGSNDISEEIMQLKSRDDVPNLLKGDFYNKRKERVDVNLDTINGQMIKGHWHKSSEENGSFELRRTGNNTFEGYYNFNGQQYTWSGKRYIPNDRNIVTVDDLNFRTRPLTRSEIRKLRKSKYRKHINQETLIGELTNEHKFEKVSYSGRWTKIITKYEGHLRIGYIITLYGGLPTYK